MADPADLADPGGPAGLADLWADRAFLRDVQYRTDANLAARQSIYAYQHPRIDLPARVLDLAAPAATPARSPTSAAGTAPTWPNSPRRGFGGRMVGADLSAGMLRAARGQVARVRADAAAPGARAGVAMMLLAADASALPLRDGAADLTLAMHMLYHVPDPVRAVGELRRVTRPGGRVVVGLNGADHMKELREIIATAREVDLAALFGRITLDDGEALLRTVFTSVTRHDLPAELHVPGPEPVADYVRSMSRTQAHADPERLVAEVLSKLPGGLFRITTHAGCLVCT